MSGGELLMAFYFKPESGDLGICQAGAGRKAREKEQ